MSAAGVAKLESLLERVQRNRERGGAVAARSVGPGPVAREPVAAPLEEALELKITGEPADSLLELELPSDDRAPFPSASRVGRPPVVDLDLPDLDLPELDLKRAEPELALDDGGDDPQLTVGEEDADDDLDLEPVPADLIPTAPVGTRAPDPTETPTVVAAPAPITAPVVTPSPVMAQPLQLERAAPSAPVARTVARPAPATAPTFGDLLARTLALRPR